MKFRLDRITNFMAIVQYLARKHKLMPDINDEKSLVDMDVLREEAVDVVWATINYVYFYNHRQMVMKIFYPYLDFNLLFYTYLPSHRSK